MPPPELRQGERLLAMWRPRLSVYLKRMLFIALAWVVVGGGVGAVLRDPLIGAATFLGSLVFYIVAFEDGQDWRRRRGETWTLTTQRLVFQRPTDAEAFAELPLDNIRRARIWMFWSVQLRLPSGQQTPMRFLPNVRAVRDQINAAKQERAHA